MTIDDWRDEKLNDLRIDLGKLRREAFSYPNELIELEIEYVEQEIMNIEKEINKTFPPDESGKVHLPPFVINDINPVLAQSGDTVDWGITALKIPQIHSEFGITGKGVKVAIVDTAADLQHEDLIGAIIENHNTTNEKYVPTNGHGSGCAALIGARKNDKGILSVAPDCQIIAIKALLESGSGNMVDITEAVNLAIDRGAQVISMSLGGSSTVPGLKTAIKRATDAGIYVICAAGNAGQDNSVGYPAKYPEAYAVAATNQASKVSAFSSRGPEVDIAAPGERILTAWKNGGYATVSGTSFACPITAGCFALFIEAGIKVTPSMTQVTAIDIEEPGVDLKSGYGLINPYELIKKYKATTIAAKCDAPVPVVTSISKNSATISWNAVPGGFNYSPFLGLQGVKPIEPMAITKENSTTITGLSAGRTYTFEIRANCSNGISAPGTVTFTTEGGDIPPALDTTKVRSAITLLEEFIAGKV